jgi:5-methylcytosine-specific restriction endonuclease McrBC regulatory subunit McrC
VWTIRSRRLKGHSNEKLAMCMMLKLFPGNEYDVKAFKNLYMMLKLAWRRKKILS